MDGTSIREKFNAPEEYGTCWSQVSEIRGQFILTMAKASRVSDSDGLHLYGWMRNVLNLSGGELITFAIVFRSSQSKTGIYTGGIPYVADFVGCSKETARKSLHTLEDMGLIEGMDEDKNGVRYRNYQVIDNHIPKNLGIHPKILERIRKICRGDTQKSWDRRI